MQSTLTNLYRHRRRIDVVDNLDAYVYRSLLNAFHRSRRRRWSGEVPSDQILDNDLGVVLGAGDATPEALDLRAALRAVSPDRRAVLVLKFFHDLTEQQISQLLGVPVGTVKSRASRGLEELRRHYPIDDPIAQEQQ